MDTKLAVIQAQSRHMLPQIRHLGVLNQWILFIQ